MPDCLKCGTWNPEDKNVCWRCQAELPKPVVKKQRGPVRVLGLSIWIWLAMIFFVIMMIVMQYIGRATGA